MDNIKPNIREWLDVSQNRLNDIALEDVKLEASIKQTIHKAISQMQSLNNLVDQPTEQTRLQTDDITCKGFWVENTKELVLYVWVGNQSKAIVVPQEGWTIRDDITIN